MKEPITINILLFVIGLVEGDTRLESIVFNRIASGILHAETLDIYTVHSNRHCAVLCLHVGCYAYSLFPSNHKSRSTCELLQLSTETVDTSLQLDKQFYGPTCNNG